MIFSHSGLRTSISSQIAHIFELMRLVNHVHVFILMLVPVVNVPNNVYAVSVWLWAHRNNVEHNNGKNVAYQWTMYSCVISRFYQSVNEVFTLLVCCTVLIGSSLKTFRDILYFPSSRGLIGCSETLVTGYQLTLCNIPEQQRPHLWLLVCYSVEIRPVLLVARMVVIFLVQFRDTVESTPKAVWDQDNLKTRLRGVLNEQNMRSDIIDLRGLIVKGKCTLDCVRQNR